MYVNVIPSKPPPCKLSRLQFRPITVMSSANLTMTLVLWMGVQSWVQKEYCLVGLLYWRTKRRREGAYLTDCSLLV